MKINDLFLINIISFICFFFLLGFVFNGFPTPINFLLLIDILVGLLVIVEWRRIQCVIKEE